MDHTVGGQHVHSPNGDALRPEQDAPLRHRPYVLSLAQQASDGPCSSVFGCCGTHVHFPSPAGALLSVLPTMVFGAHQQARVRPAAPATDTCAQPLTELTSSEMFTVRTWSAMVRIRPLEMSFSTVSWDRRQWFEAGPWPHLVQVIHSDSLSSQVWRREDEERGSPERAKPAVVLETGNTMKTLSPGRGCRCGTVPTPEVWKGPGEGGSSWRLMAKPWQPQPTAACSHRAYCCKKVDQTAISKAVHSFITWGKDCEGPRSIQDRRQPTVLWQQNRGLDRSLPQSPTRFLPPTVSQQGAPTC